MIACVRQNGFRHRPKASDDMPSYSASMFFANVQQPLDVNERVPAPRQWLNDSEQRVARLVQVGDCRRLLQNRFSAPRAVQRS